MSPQISQIYYYPIKGMTEASLSLVDLSSTGIPNDRAMAFVFVDGLSDEQKQIPPEDLNWMSKAKIAVQNDWPALAALKMKIDPSGELRIRAPDNKEHIWSTTTQEGRSSAANFVAEYLSQATPSPAARHPVAGPLVLAGKLGSATRFPDRDREHVSLLSLTTLKSVEEKVGAPIDIRRFRGNLIVDGLPAWEEQNWLKKRIQVGQTELECTGFIIRCFNINVNPETGIADLDLLNPIKEMTSERLPQKVPIFGVLARVIKPGKIGIGDKLTVS